MIPILRCVTLALNEVSVNRLRTILMVVCVAAAVATMTLVSQLGATAEQEIAETVTRTQGLAGTVRVEVSDTSRDVQLDVLNPDGIEHAAGRLAPLGDAQISVEDTTEPLGFPLAAVDPGLVAAFPNDLTSGRWLVEADRTQALLPVVLGPQVAGSLRKALGAADTSELNGLTLQIDFPQPIYLQVVGVLADGPLVRRSDQAGMFVPLGVDGIAPPLRAWVYRADSTASPVMNVYLNDPASPQTRLTTATTVVKARLSAEGIQDATVRGERVDTSADFANATHTLSIMLRSIGLAVLAVGVTAVAVVSMMSLRERAGELALRRAMGTTPRSLAALVLIENVVIVLLGGLVGLVVAVAIGLALARTATTGDGQGLGTVQLATALFALGSTTIMGVLLGLIPARRASRHQIMDVLSS